MSNSKIQQSTILYRVLQKNNIPKAFVLGGVSRENAILFRCYTMLGHEKIYPHGSSWGGSTKVQTWGRSTFVDPPVLDLRGYIFFFEKGQKRGKIRHFFRSKSEINSLSNNEIQQKREYPHFNVLGGVYRAKNNIPKKNVLGGVYKGKCNIISYFTKK